MDELRDIYMAVWTWEKSAGTQATAQEAEEIFDKQVERWRGESWESLCSHLNEPVAYEIDGPSGTRYQIEVLIFWDGGRRGGARSGHLRVFITSDDGKGWKILGSRMRKDDFIKAPDGSFIGE